MRRCKFYEFADDTCVLPDRDRTSTVFINSDHEIWVGSGASRSHRDASGGGIAVLCFKASPLALTLEAGKGIWNAATILLVIWPAVFSYELTCESKGFLAIRRGIQHVTKHELLQILILGWIFPSFLQGITGFGVAVAVGAPLLLSIGVTPFYSIIIVLLCHCWGATFGTLALAWEALIAQAGMNPAQMRRQR